jgi:hypothetical protein
MKKPGETLPVHVHAHRIFSVSNLNLEGYIALANILILYGKSVLEVRLCIASSALANPAHTAFFVTSFGATRKATGFRRNRSEMNTIQRTSQIR